jgi:hypothetical protein
LRGRRHKQPALGMPRRQCCQTVESQQACAGNG